MSALVLGLLLAADTLVLVGEQVDCAKSTKLEIVTDRSRINGTFDLKNCEERVLFSGELRPNGDARPCRVESRENGSITYVGEGLGCANGTINVVPAPGSQLSKTTLTVAQYTIGRPPTIAVQPCDRAGCTITGVSGPYTVVATNAVATVTASGVLLFPSVIRLAMAQKLVVRLPAPPPSRVICSADSETGQHTQLEWEAGGTPGLAQTARLPPGAWKLSCSAEPYYPPTQTPPQANQPLANAGWIIETSHFVVVSRRSALLPVRIAEDPGSPTSRHVLPIELFWDDLPALDEVVAQLGASNGGSGGGRSLEFAVPPAVVEGLQVLTEVVVERAKRGAARTAQRLLRKAVCDNLPRSLIDAGIKGTARVLEGPLLANACRAIENLRLDDLVSQGTQLYRALLTDLVEIVMERAQRALSLAAQSPLLQELGARTLAHAGSVFQGFILGRQLDATREAQLLLADLAQAVARILPDLAKLNNKEPACGLAVGLAAISMCHADATCDARGIEEMVAHPDKFVQLGECGGIDFTKSWPDLPAFVSRGLELTRIPSATPPERVLGVAAPLVLDVLDRVLQKTITDTQALEGLKLGLSAARVVALAVANGDAAEAMIAVAGALAARAQSDAQSSALRRAGQFLGAVTAYGSTYAHASLDDADKSTQQQREAELHQRRKEAIESVIEAFANRAGRGGDAVFSLGATVGVIAGGVQAVAGWTADASMLSKGQLNSGGAFAGQLAVPLGMALQLLPSESTYNIGFHLGFQAIDLGTFLAYGRGIDPSRVQWNAFLSPGIQGGILLGTAEDAAVVAIDLHYAPNVLVLGREPGVTRLGLLVGYYVSIFDFN